MITRFRKSLVPLLMATSMLTVAGLESAQATVSVNLPEVTVENDDYTAFAELGTWIAGQFSGGAFNGLFAGLTSLGNLSSICNCSWGGSISPNFTFTGTTGSILGLVFGDVTNRPGGIEFNLDSISGTNYTFKLLSYTVDFDNSKVTTYVNAFSTVPGPIAGAGIPAALGLIGFAAWRRRQAATVA